MNWSLTACMMHFITMCCLQKENLVGRHGIFGRGILSLQIKNEVGSGVGGLVKHKIIMTNERKETVWRVYDS